ncbi:MAG: hypothetical protein QOG37_982, partial [Mycobacterium sp.]|nr:hypothetical protein [Mycobacterium sp.]
KQHYVIDVASGLLVACAAYAIFVHPLPRPAADSKDVRAARLGLIIYVGVYAVFLAVLGALFLADFRPWQKV